MKTLQRRTAAAATLLATALTLTACGGDTGNDKIQGAEKSPKSTSPSPSPSPTADDADRPKMDFPDDVKIVFEDWKTSKGPKAQAALDDAANYVRSIYHGIVEQDADDPAHLHYSTPTGQAQSYAEDRIKHDVAKEWTLTGVDHFYKPGIEVADGAKRAVVTFCEDTKKIFNKEVDTDEKVPTGEDAGRYLSYTIVMEPVPEEKGLWWADSVEIQNGANGCAL